MPILTGTPSPVAKVMADFKLLSRDTEESGSNHLCHSKECNLPSYPQFLLMNWYQIGEMLF